MATARRAAPGRLAGAGALALGLACGLALGLAACSSSTRSGAPATGTAATTSVAPAAAGTVVPGPGASTVAPTTVAAADVPTTAATPGVPTTAATTGVLEHPSSGVEFLSPSRNISCQIDNGPPYPDQSAYCQSVATDTSATLAPDGTYRTCHNTGCLGNPAPNIPVLAYGQSVTLGPFTCSSATDGMTCVAAGKGFLIARAGVVAATA